MTQRKTDDEPTDDFLGQIRRAFSDPSNPNCKHDLRFKKVAGNYPKRVFDAYDGDIEAALRDSDKQVALRVGVYEVATLGHKPIDWVQVGEVERGFVRTEGHMRDMEEHLQDWYPDGEAN